MNGKDIILQRLRNNKNIKKFKFLGAEIRNQVFDLLSNKYIFYRKNELNFIFPTVKVKKTINQILNEEKPVWMSQASYKYLLKNKDNEEKFYQELKESIKKYDEKTNKYFSSFINMHDDMVESLQTKGQNPLYIVNYLISGKLDDDAHTEFRAPFAFTEIEDLKINHQTGEVTIIPTDKILINIPFISWVGNKLNIDTEQLIRSITSTNITDDYIDEFCKIYSKIKINLNKNAFNALSSSELKLCRENTSIKNAKATAEHEAKHLVCALNYKFDVDIVDINKNDDVMGQVWMYADNDDADLEKLITILLAPYTDIENISYEYVTDHLDNPDFDDISSNLNSLSSDVKQKELIFNKCLQQAKDLLLKYDKQIKTFSNTLFKNKSLSSDEIISIWNGEEINTDIQNNELKFELNKFNVEEVRLLTLCPEIAEIGIFKDVEEIFENSKFIENLLESDLNKRPTNKMDESKIAWGFDADFSQQKAVYDTLLNENSIIQGPPGTGKTQIILNIISNAIANDKKVLVVAEKTTAVDVIKERIEKYAPELKCFIFDLYNINKLGIEFYRQLGWKVSNVNNSKSINGQHKNPYSLQQKVDKISSLGERLENINLSDIVNQAKDININENDLKLLSSLSTKNIDLLAQYDKDKIDTINEWNNLKNILTDFRSKYFAQNISENIIKKLYELNNSEPYNEQSSYKYASILLKNKEKVNLFFRGKYKKLAKENKLDILFTQDFDNFKKYIDFNFELFNKKDFLALDDIKQIEQSSSSIQRLLDVTNFLKTKDRYSKLVNDINNANILEYVDINSSCNFGELHKKIYAKLKNKFDDSYYRFSKDIKEVSECCTRQKMTKVVKSLISDHWNFLYEFFPIVLTTPELLSHYIPNKQNLYDIVIIDEASQFLIEKSIPALYRGKRRIISGDNQQLRPKIDNRFSSFEWNGNDQIKYHQLVESESILDFFEKLFGASGTMLTTHYRSEKNELIKFSNDNFYDGKLNFIEHAQSLNKKNAIEIIDVKGKWIDQTNQEEADEIIKQLISIYSNNPDASVGVIVFSKIQATLIKKTLLKNHSPEISNVTKSFQSTEPDTLFIKSIDEVQGEERNIIIFGITYGNKVHNYMLLSDEYAKNKINVAITRAKKKIIIIKSHKASEYRRINNQNNLSGSAMLFKFLEYAESTANINSKSSNKIDLSEIDNDFVKYLKSLGKEIYKIVSIRNKKFFIVNGEKMEIYFIVDENSMKDARNQIWFFEALFNSRGYESKPILITDIYKV